MSIDSIELPSSSDPSIVADNSKTATPHHVWWDASVQGTSGTFLSTRFWTNYIDRVSPHAEDSRIGRTRALATCVMADLCALYGMCSKADPCAARDTLLSYRAEHKWTHLTVCAWVRHNIVPSVLPGGHGCSPRMANVFSPLRPAKLRSGHMGHT